MDANCAKHLYNSSTSRSQYNRGRNQLKKLLKYRLDERDSNPYFSAKIIKAKHIAWLFLFLERQKRAFVSEVEKSSPLVPLQEGEIYRFSPCKSSFWRPIEFGIC